MTPIVPTSVLEALIDMDNGQSHEGILRLDDEAIDMGRWTEQRHLIIEVDGAAYAVCYEVGLTEMQECDPFEFQPDPVPLHRVRAKVVSRTIWEVV